MENTGHETWRDGWGCFESTAAEYEWVIAKAIAEAYPRSNYRRLDDDGGPSLNTALKGVN
jgi:hypothetical protein